LNCNLRRYVSVFFNQEDKANLYFQRESASFKSTEVEGCVA